MFSFAFFLFSFFFFNYSRAKSCITDRTFVDIVWWHNVRIGSTLSKEHSWECVILMTCWMPQV